MADVLINRKGRKQARKVFLALRKEFRELDRQTEELEERAERIWAEGRKYRLDDDWTGLRQLDH